MGRALGLGLLLLSMGCATVSRVEITPDYAQKDRTTTLRLGVLICPLPAQRPELGTLWGLMALRYVNLHRDFIVKAHRSMAELPAKPCDETWDGVLHLSPLLVEKDGEVEVSVVGKLTRCRDERLVWEAEGDGVWASEDAQLKEMTMVYVEELGAEVRSYVAPSFRLLRAVLDTLPHPKLESDEDIMEKIELDE